MPKNTVIAFDLHEVIFTFDYKKIAKILWHSHQKFTIFTTLFHFSFIITLIKMIWHDPTDEEFYDLFERKRPALLNLIVDLTNAQKLVPGMAEIVHKLHSRGYTLHILSNIGPRRFKQLSLDFPSIINYFDSAQIIQPKAKPILKKPATQFFKKYLRNYVEANQTVIFIDDNKQNIEAARKLGITAIHFKTAKKLQMQLQKMGIL